MTPTRADVGTDGYTVRFSVVVPALDEADLLGTALESLLAQDFAGGYEVIVVDNGSVDDTAAVARRYGVRVVLEPHRGVCAARQRGTAEAIGEIVVSTDADTSHPADWLSRIDARFRSGAGVRAVAGPCRYADPSWWAAVFPRCWFATVAGVYAASGHIFYLTATNVAFERSGFPGYDTALTQGGDEVDLLRRLRSRGGLVWDAGNAVSTSSRRLDQGLAYTLLVSFGYHYAGSYLVNRLSSRTVVGVAPPIRSQHADLVRRRRLRWRVGTGALAGMVALHAVRRRGSR